MRKNCHDLRKNGKHVSQEWGQQHFSFLDHSLKNKTFHSDADQKVRYRTFLGTLHFVLCLGFLLTKLNRTNFISNRGANRNTVALHTFRGEQDRVAILEMQVFLVFNFLRLYLAVGVTRKTSSGIFLLLVRHKSALTLVIVSKSISRSSSTSHSNSSGSRFLRIFQGKGGGRRKEGIECKFLFFFLIQSTQRGLLPPSRIWHAKTLSISVFFLQISPSSCRGKVFAQSGPH